MCRDVGITRVLYITRGRDKRETQSDRRGKLYIYICNQFVFSSVYFSFSTAVIRFYGDNSLVHLSLHNIIPFA